MLISITSATHTCQCQPLVRATRATGSLSPSISNTLLTALCSGTSGSPNNYRFTMVCTKCLNGCSCGDKCECEQGYVLFLRFDMLTRCLVLSYCPPVCVVRDLTRWCTFAPCTTSAAAGMRPVALVYHVHPSLLCLTRRCACADCGCAKCADGCNCGSSCDCGDKCKCCTKNAATACTACENGCSCGDSCACPSSCACASCHA